MAKKHHEYAKQFNRLGYIFRMNDMDDSVEVNDWRMNDGMSAEIESRMADNSFSVGNCRRAWTYEAHKARYHPLKDYFNNLAWGGQDSFGNFMACFDFIDSDFARISFWRFMLGVVGKVLEQDQNFMLVLDGPQGIGKSWLSRWLCPNDLYFVEGSLNPDHNDTKLRIIANLLWEVGELQYTTRKADTEAIKNIITQREITTRPPYHRHDIRKPVCCSFIGTINENGAGFLNDPTGSRRFAVAKIKSIDWLGYTKIDVNQIWAQITQAYQAGERGNLQQDEQIKQHEINSQYTLISSTHELLLKFYHIDSASFPNDWLPAADVLLTLFENGMTGSQKAAQMEIASIMEKLDIEKSNIDSVTNNDRLMCYRGVRKR